MSVFRPTPAHRDVAPAVCPCADCSRIVIAMRCPHRDRENRQCGDYRQHRGPHSLIVATVFQIATDRVGTEVPA